MAMLAMAVGCQVDDRTPRTAPPPVTAAPIEPEPVPTERVDALLSAADDAFADDRLLYPAPDSALTHYIAVLELVPDQPDALHGLERIVEAFIERAQRAMRQQRWGAARSMLDRARIADRDHPSLPSLYRQLQHLRDARRLKLELSPAAVRARAPDVADGLVELGQHARQANARVYIRAGSDAEGRWMYAQLNRAHGERRIRAEMEIGRPPQVVVVLLPTADP